MANRRQSLEPAADAIDGAARPAPRHRRRRPRTAADRTAATGLSRPRIKAARMRRVGASANGVYNIERSIEYRLWRLASKTPRPTGLPGDSRARLARHWQE